jgi:hypothetical protein
MATNHSSTLRIALATDVKAAAEASGSAKLVALKSDNTVLATQDVTLSALGAGALEDYEFDCTNLPQIPDAVATGDVARVELQTGAGTAVVISTAPMTGIPASATSGSPFGFKSYKYTAP